MWLFDKIQYGSAKTTQVGNRHLRKRKILIKVEKTAPYNATFTPNTSVDSECVIFTLADLYSIIEYDLDNSYSQVGNQLMKQPKGCPMGGLLSAFYANTTCSYHENSFLNKERLADHIYGIRQMDDLTLFIAHAKGDADRTTNNTRIKHEIQYNMYKGGLEATLEAPDIDSPTKYIHKFAGHEIHTHKNLSDIYTTTLNENADSVHTLGRQKKVRYPNMRTYTNNHCKVGNIIGSIHRIRAQNTYRSDFTHAITDLVAELKCINYTSTTIKACLYKLARQESWKTMLDNNLRLLSHRETQPIEANTRTTPIKSQPTLTEQLNQGTLKLTDL